jgi:hypothetical protein
MGARCVCPPVATKRSFGSAVTRCFSSILGRATVVESASPPVPKERWNSSRDANDETFDRADSEIPPIPAFLMDARARIRPVHYPWITPVANAITFTIAQHGS